MLNLILLFIIKFNTKMKLILDKIYEFFMETHKLIYNENYIDFYAMHMHMDLLL